MNFISKPFEKVKSRLKGEVSIEYVVLLVCIALATLVAFRLTGKSIGGIINNTKDMLIEKVDNATNNANGESGSGPTYEIIDGDKDGKHYHNDELFTGTCNGKEYVDGVEQTPGAVLYGTNIEEKTFTMEDYDELQQLQSNADSFEKWNKYTNALSELQTNGSVTVTNEVIDTSSVIRYTWEELIEEGYITVANGEFRLESLYGQLKEILIPDSVTSIGDYAFLGCSNLTSVTIPDSVISIGQYAFQYCSSLTSITIPNSVTSIGTQAFMNCTNLTSITIPDSVTSIGNYAFHDCTNLTSVTIGNSVTSIGDGAFGGCESLTSITIPNSVTSIGKEAFKYCYNLQNITIPNSVTSIGSCVFQECTSLTSITYKGETYPYLITDNVLVSWPTASGNIEIPDGVTSIGRGAFWNCEELTSVEIPEGVTSIKQDAFNGCTSLTSIEIPEGVTSIGSNTFSYCESLTSITIPNSVTSIGSNAVSHCTSLISIIYEGTMAEWSAISLGSYWHIYAPVTRVICSDGTVSL